MIFPIRGDWSDKTIAAILKALAYRHIVVPLAAGTKGIAEKLAIVEKAEAEGHPTLKQLGGGPGFVLFTSGTTGAPKAVLHDFRKFHKRFEDRKLTPYRTVMFLLFDHIGGWNTLFYTLAAGGVPVYVPERRPEAVCRIIEEEKAELLPTTPTFLNMVIYTQAYKRYDLRSLKVVTYGTEPMSQTTLDAVHFLFPWVQFKQTYGLSELGILGTKSESSDSLWVKVGGQGYETQIRDGILWIRSETSMVGYLNAPSPFDSEGWYCTGDKVAEGDGYIRFLGRDSDIINVGGIKVSPVEVESAILELDGIRDAEVHGESNPILGQVVVATVATDREGVEREVIRHCREKLGKQRSPVRVRIVKDIPITERYKKRHLQ